MNLGGGTFSGFELATKLGRTLGKKKKAQITLQDAASTHIWKPLLHEVAAGSLDGSEQVEYLASQHVSFLLAYCVCVNELSFSSAHAKALANIS